MNIDGHRYSAKTFPTLPTCNHPIKSTHQCQKLTLSDVKKFHGAFYQRPIKKDQDAFILKYCVVRTPKRRRARTKERAAKGISIEYFVKKNTKCIQVCQKCFCQILDIKKGRIQNIMKSFLTTGQQRIDNRGGDHKKFLYQHKRKSVTNFIKTLRGSYSHYARGKSSNRLYMSCELSIKKLWQMYNDKVNSELQVKQTFFRNIFNRNFNIGFGSPRKDVCSTCLSLDEKIKRTLDYERKLKLIEKKKIHTTEANNFFDHLRESRDDLIIFSYDCQKNLPLPKIPDQIVYYKRQVYMYNFTIVQGSSHSCLTNENVHSYLWTENEYGKGSNEIASAVYHRLNSHDWSDSKIKTVRLVADGCAGQNKNTIILLMASKWLVEAPAHIKTVELVFPVTGHSFMPADRVFGNIEKRIKKIENIVTPEEYINEIKNAGSNILRGGQDWDVYDWKTEAQRILKSTSSLHFRISKIKKLVISRVKKSKSVVVQAYRSYSESEGATKPILKRGCNFSTVNLEMIGSGREVKRSK